ncbi:hypothetical protein AgCh_005904 [Apium graveolens]
MLIRRIQSLNPVILSALSSCDWKSLSICYVVTSLDIEDEVEEVASVCPGLVMNFYNDSCPQAEDIIKEQVRLLYKRHKNTAFSWLRNILHDYVVQAETCESERSVFEMPLLLFVALVGATVGDKATFTTVLSACSHASLVDNGIHIFNSMVIKYGFELGVDHFSCIVDLLGRAGHLDVDEKLITW